MKKLILVTLLATILISGCAPAVSTPTHVISPEESDKPIKIGFVGPLTGEGASIGAENLRGVELAVEEVNERGGIGGTKVEIVVEDDQSDEVSTVAGYKKLTSVDGVEFVLAPTYGGYLALAESAALDNVIVINPLDASEELSNIGKNNFAIGIYDESIGFAIADYLNESRVGEVGAIVLQDPFAALVVSALAERFQGELEIEEYSLDETDYRSILSKVAEYDTLVVIGFDEAGRVIRQAREMGIDAKIVGIDTFTSESFKTNARGYTDGLKFTFWEGAADNRVYHDLVRTYKSEYGAEPENQLFLATGYDAAHILMRSMQGCVGRFGCIRSNLKKTRGHLGATGVVDIDEDQITRSIREEIYQYKDEEILPMK